MVRPGDGAVGSWRGLELVMPGGVRPLLLDDSQTILGTLITPS